MPVTPELLAARAELGRASEELEAAKAELRDLEAAKAELSRTYSLKGHAAELEKLRAALASNPTTTATEPAVSPIAYSLGSYAGLQEAVPAVPVAAAPVTTAGSIPTPAPIVVDARPATSSGGYNSGFYAATPKAQAAPAPAASAPVAAAPAAAARAMRKSALVVMGDKSATSSGGYTSGFYTAPPKPDSPGLYSGAPKGSIATPVAATVAATPVVVATPAVPIRPRQTTSKRGYNSGFYASPPKAPAVSATRLLDVLPIADMGPKAAAVAPFAPTFSPPNASMASAKLGGYNSGFYSGESISDGVRDTLCTAYSAHLLPLPPYRFKFSYRSVAGFDRCTGRRCAKPCAIQVCRQGWQAPVDCAQLYPRLAVARARGTERRRHPRLRRSGRRRCRWHRNGRRRSGSRSGRVSPRARHGLGSELGPPLRPPVLLPQRDGCEPVDAAR